MTMFLQVVCTNWERLGEDTATFWSFVAGHDADLLDTLTTLDLPTQQLLFYGFMWINIVGFLFAMPLLVPPETVNAEPVAVPHRTRRQRKQHKLVNIDCSYIFLNVSQKREAARHRWSPLIHHGRRPGTGGHR